MSEKYELIYGLQEYQDLAMRTAKDMGSDKMNLIHAALGMTSDAGEFATAIKSCAVYGKELDWDNAVEEIGDVLWFCALACKTLGTSLSEVAAINIEKLKARYPDKYSDEAAIARADKKEKVWFLENDINELVAGPFQTEVDCRYALLGMTNFKRLSIVAKDKL